MLWSGLQVRAEKWQLVTVWSFAGHLSPTAHGQFEDNSQSFQEICISQLLFRMPHSDFFLFFWCVLFCGLCCVLTRMTKVKLPKRKWEVSGIVRRALPSRRRRTESVSRLPPNWDLLRMLLGECQGTPGLGGPPLGLCWWNWAGTISRGSGVPWAVALQFLSCPHSAAGASWSSESSWKWPCSPSRDKSLGFVLLELCFLTNF